MRIFSNVSSQDFVLIKILSHTINQVGIWQAYTVYELSESLIRPIHAKRSNQLICCLRAILQFQHRLDALSVPTVVAKINRVSMEEHVGKTVRRPENDSFATVQALLARFVSRVKQFWSIMQLQSHILWAIFSMLQLNRILNQSKGSLSFLQSPWQTSRGLIVTYN